MSTETPPTDLVERRRRLTAFLETNDLNAVWVARPNNFAWLTGGSNIVDRDATVGVAAAGYQRDVGFRLITNTIEASRLADEEVPDAFSITAVDWYTDSLAAAVAAESPTPAVADFDVPGVDQSTFAELRQPLTADDINRYRLLGEQTAAAVESICRELTPEQTEQAVAVDVRTALESRGIATPVVLVGGSKRAQQYRHYTPSTSELGEYALVSVTAQRGGLYASLTRTVAFDPPAWLADRHQAATTVEVSALQATQQAAREESTASEVFKTIQQAYDSVGYPTEWQNHHQGGAAGFAGREWIATPTETSTVFAPQAYAWNPTVQGAKSEGTVLVSTDRIEPLTMTGNWPTQSVSAASTVDGTLALERPAVLSL